MADPTPVSPSLHASPGGAFFLGGSASTTTNNPFQPQSYSFLIVLLVVANILSALFLAIVRFNTLLFADYTAEFVYAVLLSEALFAPRQRIVKWLQTLADEKFWAPRAYITQSLSHRGRASAAIICTVVVFQSDLAMLKTIVLMSWMMAMICIMVDSKLAYVFRIHTLVISDESLAAISVLLVLLVSLVTIVGVFLYLSLRDAALALDAMTEALGDVVNEHVLNNSGIRGAVVDAINDAGRISTYLNAQFEGSAFGPLVKSLSLSFLQQIEKSRSSAAATAVSDGDKAILMMTSTWDTISNPQTWNWKAAIESVSLDSVSKSLLKDSVQVTDVLKSTSAVVFASVVVALSFVFALFDSVVRLLFSLTMLFFLLTSKDSLSQVIMKSLRGVMNDSRDRANLEAFENELVRTFEACFILPVALSLCHGLAVLVVMGLLNFVGWDVPAPFFAASLVALVTLFPFISPSLVVILPWGMYAAMIQGRPWISMALAVAITSLFWWIDDSLLSSFSRHRRGGSTLISHSSSSSGYFMSGSSSSSTSTTARRNSEDGDIVRRNAYLTGLSLFLGVTAFGLHGVVFGPLIVSFLLTSYSLTYNTARDASQRIWKRVTAKEG